MAYRSKYKIPFRELHTDELWEAFIFERDFTGAETELTGSAKPLIREYRKENDNDYDWITPSVCTLTFVSATVGLFSEFYTSDNRRYKVKVYRDSVFLWSGWLVPETFEEAYADVNFDVFITFTDGILSLKDVDWKSNGGEPEYVGYKSLMKCIEGCLNKLDLSDVKIWDGSYIYEQHMNQTDSDSPLWQAYINCYLFYDSDGKPKDCYTVLKTIIQSQNCQLWMQDGHWNIAPQNARKAAYTRREYRWALTSRANGSYYAISQTVFSTESKNHITVLNNSSVIFYDAKRTSRPGWNKMIVKQNYGFDANILAHRLPQFSANFRGGITDKGYVRNYNHYFNGTDHGTNDYLIYDCGPVVADENQFFKISFIGSGVMGPDIHVYIEGNDQTLYVDSDGHWHNNPDSAVYTIGWSSSTSWEPVVTEAIPINGTLKIKIDACTDSSRHNALFNSYKLTDFKIELITSMIFYEDIDVITEINENNFYTPETIELALADCPIDEPLNIITYYEDGTARRQRNQSGQDSTNARLIYSGILFYKSGSDYIITALWTVKGKNQYNRLVNIISDEIAVNHTDPQLIIPCTIYGALEYGSILSVDGKNYMFLNASQSAYDKEWEGELFEISDTEQGYLKLRSGGYVKLRTGDKIKTQ